MLNLASLTTRTITSADLQIACQPLTFEVKTFFSRPAWLAMVKFEESYQDVEAAREVIARCFVSVEQDGRKYPLGSREAVDELREAAGEVGDEFICVLAHRFINNHYGFFPRGSADSATPLPPSADGNIPE